MTICILLHSAHDISLMDYSECIQVVNSSAVADFLNVNSNVFFFSGATTANGVLIVQNDAIPEGNETFLLRINEARLGAEIGPVKL